jgi:hypothetical protein
MSRSGVQNGTAAKIASRPLPVVSRIQIAKELCGVKASRRSAFKRIAIFWLIAGG